MHTDRIQYLTSKFFAGTCSPEEKLELAEWARQHPDDELGTVLENEWGAFKSDIRMPEQMSDRILGNIFDQSDRDTIVKEPAEDRSVQYLWLRIAAAAVLILSLGIYWWSGKDQRPIAQLPVPALKEADLPPGGNKATLTLGDGSSIVLDGAENGSLASEGGTNVIKSKKGELVYSSSGKSGLAAVFNTVATPKGGQYHIVLPDGSKAWLNAVSSLRFPTAFRGKERKVEITGEVYFEVAHNAKMPFIVTTAHAQVRVLGTHFNVMAYPDENVLKTTLLEGSVQVSNSAGKSAMLSPGQQARIKSLSGQIGIADNIDIEKEMAWKNGYFQFQDDNLEQVMRQISRWYDVEVVYEGMPGKETFTGRLPRNANVSKVFKILSLSGVRCRIEGKSIVVNP
ncbi:iron dicitrate transporter FecR [Dyadobacter beijingensis]|uniref:Iron dicitrate transporter FecR n=1 Tax=Dyadobacter beijingensis TaxID=365489 RepID=A0ABQ2ICN1_9BACT|nr:FecR domain-containing protein [Dyadobacter beijingensis]GGN07138.1 iron dicitrate transporter FecR [Dyadobacter beijingensis]